MANRLHVLDRQVRRRAHGRLLLGGSPARLVRLSEAGAAALDRVLAGVPEPGDTALRDRLRRSGILHPVGAGALADVSFVVPVRDGGDPLPRLVEQLRRWGEVVVVDDGSRDGSAERATAAGARVIANTSGTSGPAAARNLGLRATSTEFVAFIDADCHCEEDWARPLAGLLAEDAGLIAAAPRVRSGPGPGALARYERQRSALDMGAKPALVGPGRRIAYVPTAAIVVRRSDLAGLGGFDESLRFGEDVDLCWRAVEAGFSVRYAPTVEVEHRPRASAAALARQRFEYGSSAAPLDRRHSGQVAPVRIACSTGLIGLAALAGCRRGATLGALGHVLWTSLRRREPDAAPALAALATQSLLYSGQQFARATSRDWLPATLLACLLSPRVRPYIAIALAIDATANATRAPRLLAPGNVALRTLENAAYAAGLWSGAIRERSPRALLPHIDLPRWVGEAPVSRDR